jgi:hypothetical protein
LKPFRGRIGCGPFYFAVGAVSSAEIGRDSRLTFAALLSAKAGVSLARLDKIYEYLVRMGDWRHGTDYHPGGRFDFVRLQENP